MATDENELKNHLAKDVELEDISALRLKINDLQHSLEKQKHSSDESYLKHVKKITQFYRVALGKIRRKVNKLLSKYPEYASARESRAYSTVIRKIVNHFVIQTIFPVAILIFTAGYLTPGNPTLGIVSSIALMGGSVLFSLPDLMNKRLDSSTGMLSKISTAYSEIRHNFFYPFLFYIFTLFLHFAGMVVYAVVDVDAHKQIGCYVDSEGEPYEITDPEPIPHWTALAFALCAPMALFNLVSKYFQMKIRYQNDLDTVNTIIDELRPHNPAEEDDVASDGQNSIISDLEKLKVECAKNEVLAVLDEEVDELKSEFDILHHRLNLIRDIAQKRYSPLFAAFKRCIGEHPVEDESRDARSYFGP